MANKFYHPLRGPLSPRFLFSVQTAHRRRGIGNKRKKHICPFSKVRRRHVAVHFSCPACAAQARPTQQSSQHGLSGRCLRGFHPAWDTPARRKNGIFAARKAAIHPASTAVAAHRKAEWQKFQKLAQRKNLPIDIREKQMLQRKIAGLPVARFFASKTGAYRL